MIAVRLTVTAHCPLSEVTVNFLCHVYSNDSMQHGAIDKRRYSAFILCVVYSSQFRKAQVQ